MFIVHAAIDEVNAAIEDGDEARLLQALQTPDARLSGVIPDNVKWYFDVLKKARLDKQESTQSESCNLQHDEIQDILTIANSVAEHTRLGKTHLLLSDEGDIIYQNVREI